MKWPLALPLIALLACGGSSKHEEGPEQVLVPSQEQDAGATSEDAQVDPRLSESECQGLFDHIFEIVFTSKQQSLPPEQRPTEEDLRTAKDALRAELMGSCVGAGPATFPYECAMASKTEEEVARCLGAK